MYLYFLAFLFVSYRQSQDQEDLAFIEFLLDIGASVDRKDKNSWTPVHAAAYGSRPETLHELLERGGDCKVNTHI